MKLKRERQFKGAKRSTQYLMFSSIVFVSQEILYTDFPLDEIKLYGCWEDEVWIL